MAADHSRLPTFGPHCVKFGKPLIAVLDSQEEYEETEDMLQAETQFTVINITVEILHSYANEDWHIGFVQGQSGNQRQILKGRFGEKIAAFHPFISNRCQMINDSDPNDNYPFYSATEDSMIAISRGEVKQTSQVLVFSDCPIFGNKLVDTLPAQFPSTPDRPVTVRYTDIYLDLQFMTWVVLLKRGNNRSNDTLVDRQRFQVNHDQVYIAKTIQWQSASRHFVNFERPIGERIRPADILLPPPIIHDWNVRIPLQALLLPPVNSNVACIVYPDGNEGLSAYRDEVPMDEIAAIFSIALLKIPPKQGIVSWEKWKQETVRPGYTLFSYSGDIDLVNVSELQPEIPVPDRPPEREIPHRFLMAQNILGSAALRHVRDASINVRIRPRPPRHYITSPSTLQAAEGELRARVENWTQLEPHMFMTSQAQLEPQHVRFLPMFYHRYGPQN